MKVVQSSRFKRDIKKIKKQGRPLPELKILITILVQNNRLPKKYKDHSLSGDYTSYRECHIRPDWLLIYKITDNELLLARTGRRL
ncbi:MAG: type II toxin-antitoxin system mRNA interferase toxin, RelE/StbE family [Gammaproteobacteria bacterium]|nr:MAG: type II toxin-antitoxin system mRNA interferase toxin, RelE/StbE family [Gammaproteobacteria bacterium]